MQAFHSLWTKPLNRELEQFELLTMILSALKWREKNGRITLVTDTPGKEYIQKIGADNSWDEIVTDLDQIPNSVNPEIFWAAGKIYGLKRFKAPVMSVDTDFVVWEALESEKIKSKLCAVHSETLNSSVYPDLLEFIEYDDGFNWEVLPLNTAFVYFGDEALKEKYIEYAHKFMTSCVFEDKLLPMVFAEQRLLAMTAYKMGIKPEVFSSLEKLNSGADERFTHLWGFKRQLRENPALKKQFTQKLKNKIEKDFNKKF